MCVPSFRAYGAPEIVKALPHALEQIITERVYLNGQLVKKSDGKAEINRKAERDDEDGDRLW